MCMVTWNFYRYQGDQGTTSALQCAFVVSFPAPPLPPSKMGAWYMFVMCASTVNFILKLRGFEVKKLYTSGRPSIHVVCSAWRKSGRLAF